jgi:hypothetical protein
MGGSFWRDRTGRVSTCWLGGRVLHAIIPDIHAYNYPSERQRINDSGASTTDEAFFEIKTMTPCRSRYGHANTDTTAAEGNLCELPQEVQEVR